jgi:Flp pilus assembly protein TadD
MGTIGDLEATMRKGWWTEGVRLCREILIDRPTDARIHGYEGICRFRLTDFAGAEPCFMRATALDPKFVDAGIKRCQCLDRLHRYDEALALAREWKVQRPDDPALNAIIEAHRYRKDPLRTDGWEVSAQSMNRARFASDL